MRILRIFLAFALMAVGVISIVGSGGGGAGSSDWGKVKIAPGCCVATVPTPNVDITVANAQTVSATVVGAISQLFVVVTTIGRQVFPSPPAASSLLSSNSKFELFETVLATGEPGIDTCAVSGTVTVSSNPWNVSGFLSEGAMLDLVFDSCDDGDGYTLDGRITLAVRGLNGDPLTDVFQLKYELIDTTLTVASGADNQVTLSSPYLLFLDWNSLNFPVVELTVWPNLILGSQAGEFSWNLGGVHTLTVNADASIPTRITEGRSLVKNTALGEYIAYEIVSSVQADDDTNPDSGEILISGGAENGTIRLVIESSVSVRLEIDEDGDGTVDDYQYTTWEALRG